MPRCWPGRPPQKVSAAVRRCRGLALNDGLNPFGDALFRQNARNRAAPQVSGWLLAGCWKISGTFAISQETDRYLAKPGRPSATPGRTTIHPRFHYWPAESASGRSPRTDGPGPHKGIEQNSWPEHRSKVCRMSLAVPSLTGWLTRPCLVLGRRTCAGWTALAEIWPARHQLRVSPAPI